MKNKKGFTLPELLVVIVIIGVIAVIAIPSVILINKNINKRLYNSKVSQIVSAAELYATDNPDIFNGTSEVQIFVFNLIDNNYLEYEAEISGCFLEGGTPDNTGSIGCIIDPVTKVSMNKEKIVLRKEAVGVTATYNGRTINSADGTLVKEICNRFAAPNDDIPGSGTFTGKSDATTTCRCEEQADGSYLLKNSSGAEVDACLIYGKEENNWLLYDGVYWRVMGLYDIYGNNKLVVKMITNDAIDIVE